MPQNKVSGSPRHIWHCHGLGFPTLPSISFSLVPWITEDFQCLCWALSACVHFSPQPFAEGKALCKNTPHQRAPLIMPCPLNVYTVQREIKQKLIPKYFHKLCVSLWLQLILPSAALPGSPLCTTCSLKYGTGTPTSCCRHDPALSNSFIWLTVQVLKPQSPFLTFWSIL